MKFGTNKRIFLAAPSDFEINTRLKIKLEELGFCVVLHSYKYRWSISLIDTIIHNYRKIAYQDRSFKTNIRKVRNKKWQEKYEKNILKSYKHFDYALFIRPDQYSINFVKKIAEIADVSASYQWDGLGRFPKVKEYTKFFNRFFVFDSNDLKINPNYKFITNFYFETENTTSTIHDVFFIGSYLPERKELLNRITQRLDDAGLKTSINIFSKDKNLQKEQNHFNVVDQFYTFEENQEMIKRSKFILDISNSVHHGLSFRTFESIGYQKKLITNNQLVKEYDFYHPSNIFVFDDFEMAGLEEFISTPYQDLDRTIYLKYSFENWIKYIFEINPFIEINQP